MLFRIVAAAALTATLAAPALAAGEAIDLPKQKWSFAALFGTYDRAELQRGLQVYKEVCAACHSLQYVAYRNLGDAGGPGFTEAEVKAIAASVQVTAGPNDAGEMFERPGEPQDKFKSPFPNAKAAAAANGGKAPPDLSLMVKARADGANYLHALMLGYVDPPAGFQVPEGGHYNKYFPGHVIAMPKVLNEGQVEYTDGTKATVDQMARDVTAFLAWTAEPKLEERHRLGLRVIIFLIVLTGLFYALKRRIWAALH